jgi:hypothetical protein
MPQRIGWSNKSEPTLYLQWWGGTPVPRATPGRPSFVGHRYSLASLNRSVFLTWRLHDSLLPTEPEYSHRRPADRGSAADQGSAPLGTRIGITSLSHTRELTDQVIEE